MLPRHPHTQDGPSRVHTCYNTDWSLQACDSTSSICLKKDLHQPVLQDLRHYLAALIQIHDSKALDIILNLVNYFCETAFVWFQLNGRIWTWLFRLLIRLTYSRNSLTAICPSIILLIIGNYNQWRNRYTPTRRKSSSLTTTLTASFYQSLNMRTRYYYSSTKREPSDQS